MHTFARRTPARASTPSTSTTPRSKGPHAAGLHTMPEVDTLTISNEDAAFVLLTEVSFTGFAL